MLIKTAFQGLSRNFAKLGVHNLLYDHIMPG
jgi:hypothetical protein